MPVASRSVAVEPATPALSLAERGNQAGHAAHFIDTIDPRATSPRGFALIASRSLAGVILVTAWRSASSGRLQMGTSPV